MRIAVANLHRARPDAPGVGPEGATCATGRRSQHRAEHRRRCCRKPLDRRGRGSLGRCASNPTSERCFAKGGSILPGQDHHAVRADRDEPALGMVVQGFAIRVQCPRRPGASGDRRGLAEEELGVVQQTGPGCHWERQAVAPWIEGFAPDSRIARGSRAGTLRSVVEVCLLSGAPEHLFYSYGSASAHRSPSSHAGQGRPWASRGPPLLRRRPTPSEWRRASACGAPPSNWLGLRSRAVSSPRAPGRVLQRALADVPVDPGPVEPQRDAGRSGAMTVRAFGRIPKTTGVVPRSVASARTGRGRALVTRTHLARSVRVRRSSGR